MTAKISDLGVARILNLTPLQVSRMTQTPGTPAYMPPEVMVASPKYDTSIDEFSYGIMMIHMFSGQWPEPQVGPNRIEGGRLIPVTEAERREKFFEAIEDGHPLMNLIHRCINNDPQLRPHAGEIIRRVSRVASQFPASFANRLEMLRRIETGEEQTRVVREEKDAVIQQKDERMMTLQQEAEQKADEIDRLNMAYSSEVEQLKLEVRDLNSKNELLVATHRAKAEQIQQKEVQIMTLQQEAEQKAGELDRLNVAYTSEIEQLKLEVRVLNSQNDILAARREVEVAEYKTKIEISDSMCEIAEKLLRQEKELSGTLTESLQEKDVVILGMKMQLTKTREYLTSNKQQVSSCGHFLNINNIAYYY